jgi:hypothetical protein
MEERFAANRVAEFTSRARDAERFARLNGGNAQLRSCDARMRRVGARIMRTDAQSSLIVPLWKSYKFAICSFCFPTD